MFANTGITLNDNSLWTYIGTNPLLTNYTADIGTNDYVPTNRLFNFIGGNNLTRDANSYFDNASAADRLTFTSAVILTSLGFFGNNRTSSTNMNVWNKGVKLGTRTSANTSSLPADKIQFPVNAAGKDLAYSSRRHQFDIIGKGFNDTEAVALSTIINTFNQTGISIQL
jgi:hypothetical protein